MSIIDNNLEARQEKGRNQAAQENSISTSKATS